MNECLKRSVLHLGYTGLNCLRFTVALLTLGSKLKSGWPLEVLSFLKMRLKTITIINSIQFLVGLYKFIQMSTYTLYIVRISFSREFVVLLNYFSCSANSIPVMLLTACAIV